MSTTQGVSAPERAPSVPSVWVVRAGRQGETVDHNLALGVVTIEWDDWVAPDLSRFESRDAYGDYIEEQFRDLTPGQRRSARDQIWRFYHKIQIGDLVVLPLKNYGAADDWIAVGRVRGAPARDTSRPVRAQHHRAAEWLSLAVSKVVVESDLRASIDSNATVFGVRAPEAARRLLHLAQHGDDPGPDAASDEPASRGAARQDALSTAASKAMFVMTWNPLKWIISPEEYESRVMESTHGRTVEDRWSTGGRRSGIAVGDDVVLLRHGADGGIVASGHATSGIDLAEDGLHRVGVAWDVWVQLEDRLPVEVLREVASRFRTQFRASGERLKPDQAANVRQKWADWIGQPLALSGDEAGVLFDAGHDLPEGAKTRVEVNRYERSRRAREECLLHHGYACRVCGLRFEERYGEIGQGFIHVHHTTPLAEVAGTPEYRLNPVSDLVPVCPNCHAMLHRISDSTLTVEELRDRMRRAPEGASSEYPQR